jgi:hypothetical protein
MVKPALALHLTGRKPPPSRKDANTSFDIHDCVGDLEGHTPKFFERFLNWPGGNPAEKPSE